MQDWSVVVPVKRLARAKSRLDLAPELRAELALAMAADTVSAASAVARVVVVTDEPKAEALRADGIFLVADEPRSGLNEALSYAAEEASRRWPAARVAALAGDLPALQPAELAVVLRTAAALHRAAVADASGLGTTLLIGAVGGELAPSFGDGSFAAHLRSGAVDLSRLAGDGLRRDVDTLADLAAAGVLGVGPRTAALAATVRH